MEHQIGVEQKAFRHRERRRVRYLAIKLETRPAEAREQLATFGEGVGFLVSVFEGVIHGLHSTGHLTPEDTRLCVQACGTTLEPASIVGCPLAYTILINNLGCTPGVPATDIEPWLDPIRRPRTFRDRPRHELIGADPDDCRRRLLEALEAERDRLDALAVRVYQDHDLPRLRQALNRVSILSDAAARRAARSHTDARVTFRQAANDLR